MLSQNISSTHTTRNSARQLRLTTPTNLEDTSNPAPSAAQRGPMHRQKVARSPNGSHQVGITNPGQSPQHHNLQVAQQHVQARPALEPTPKQSLQETPSSDVRQLSEQEFRNLQHQQLDAHLDMIMRMNAQKQDSVMVERSRSDQGPGIDAAGVFAMQSPYGHRPSSSRSLGAEHKSPAPQEWMMQLQRPLTPPTQSGPDYSPITPAQTPHSHSASQHLASGRAAMGQKHSPRSDYQSTIKAQRHRSVNGADQTTAGTLQPAFEFNSADPNATIKPASRPKALRSDLFSQDVTHGESLPSPMTSPLRGSRTFDITALNDETYVDELPKFSFPGNGGTGVVDFQAFQDGSSKSMAMRRNRSEGASFDPQTPAMSGTTGSLHSARSSVDFSVLGSPAQLLMSPGTMSIGDLSLDQNMTVEDTGVSAEEVASYVHEDFSNTKTPFTCVYPECGKQFGRRENIRSHIQTHLDDRQFRCLDCNKRFVRQHDLKRHTKIHTKEKPYKCACGNGFARQDALTRHRQRGICSGSFEGIVRTPVKRGRPRKHRPNEEDRQDKSARQRKRNTERGYASSVSGTSESSMGHSPPDSIDDEMDVDAGLSEKDIELLSGAGQDNVSLGTALGQFSMTPPMSPKRSSHFGSPCKSSANASPLASPFLSQMEASKSQHSHAGPTTAYAGTVCMAEMSQTGSQQGSLAGSPPELSHSSPPSSARLLDYDHTNVFGETSTGSVQFNDEATLSQLLSGTAEYSGNMEASWNDGSFFDLNKELSGNGQSFSGFCDEPLFSELDGRFS